MAKTRRPSLTIPPADPAPATPPSAGWVYRSDAPGAASVPLAVEVLPAEAPAPAPVPTPALIVVPSLRGRSVVDRGLSGASWPFALALVAALQPLSWLAWGPGRRLS